MLSKLIRPLRTTLPSRPLLSYVSHFKGTSTNMILLTTLATCAAVALVWAFRNRSTRSRKLKGIPQVTAIERATKPQRSEINIKYGYLQGTFGLPYGGYLVQPRSLSAPITLSESASMFSVIGKPEDILNWLSDKRQPVFCAINGRSYGSSVVAELYRVQRRWCYTWDIWDVFGMGELQLVIRASRHFIPSNFKPVLRLQLPQGVMLTEIASTIKAHKSGFHDLSRDKELNIRVIGRRGRRSFSLNDEGKSFDVCHPLLPPYRFEDDQPPVYDFDVCSNTLH